MELACQLADQAPALGWTEPRTGGLSDQLPPSRFVHIETFDVNATVTYSVSYTITNSDRQQRTYTSVNVEDDSAAFLAFANIGVTQTVRAQSIMTQTTAADKTTIARQVKFYANPNEYYSVEVYCDVIFGTFAFRSIGSSSLERLKGRAFDRQGRPRRHSTVSLLSNGKTFRTATDADGAFSFRAATLGSGAALISVGPTERKHDVQVGAAPYFELRSPDGRTAQSANE
jgi:hypothetical protein